MWEDPRPPEDPSIYSIWEPSDVSLEAFSAAHSLVSGSSAWAGESRRWSSSRTWPHGAGAYDITPWGVFIFHELCLSTCGLPSLRPSVPPSLLLMKTCQSAGLVV